MRHGVHESAIQGYASFMTQLRLLTLRASRNQWRNDLILKGKIGQSIGLAVIVGLIFLQVGKRIMRHTCVWVCVGVCGYVRDPSLFYTLRHTPFTGMILLYPCLLLYPLR